MPVRDLPLDTELHEGITLKGRIVGRKKREVTLEKTGEILHIVTYRVLAGDSVFPVDDVNPAEIYPLDSLVCAPIIIRTYAGKNGPGYTLRFKRMTEDGAF